MSNGGVPTNIMYAEMPKVKDKIEMYYILNLLYHTIPNTMYLLYQTLLNSMGTRLCHAILRYLYWSAFLPADKPYCASQIIILPEVAVSSSGD